MFWGVDIGSTYTKLAAFNADGVLAETHTLHTQVRQSERVEEFLKGRVVTKILATGYGRDSLKEALSCPSVSEIQAHAKGASHFFPEASLVIDLGGQDSKVIELREGQFVDFRMNDKCAAGTGKFLEIAATRLGMSLEEFGEACAHYDKSIEISSMCAVFAESELISLIAKNETPFNIGAGVHRSIATRLANMAKRFDTRGLVVFSGGGALNSLLKTMLEEELGVSLHTHPYPQLNGAIGAALLAKGE